jgi:hypothetical protein
MGSIRKKNRGTGDEHYHITRKGIDESVKMGGDARWLSAG